MFSFFADMATYRYHVTRVYTFNHPCEIARGLQHRRVSARASPRACRCMHGMPQREVAAKVNMRVCMHIHVCAPRNSRGTASEDASTSRHYRHLNPVYINGYPAKIRLGWRLVYVGCSRKFWGWGRRAANEDSDFKSARASFLHIRIR